MKSKIRDDASYGISWFHPIPKVIGQPFASVEMGMSKVYQSRVWT